MLDVHWFNGLILCICSLYHFVCDSPKPSAPRTLFVNTICYIFVLLFSKYDLLVVKNNKLFSLLYLIPRFFILTWRPTRPVRQQAFTCRAKGQTVTLVLFLSHNFRFSVHAFFDLHFYFFLLCLIILIITFIRRIF